MGCRLEGGWLPGCKRQGDIHGKLWNAGGKDLSAAPICVKSMSLAVGRCVLEKTRWEDWVMHRVKVEDSGLAGGHSVTETLSTGCADEF